LVGIEEIGEGIPMCDGLFCHLVRAVTWVGLGVVAVDSDHGYPFFFEPVRQVYQARFDSNHIRAVIAHDDQEERFSGVVV
jgi:hypothetical protein